MTQGGVRQVPDPQVLRAWAEEGLTQRQMAERWERESGVKLARAAFGMAMARWGITPARPRPRYDRLLPWQVSGEHLAHYDARMLRLESRRRAGGELLGRDGQRLTSWRRSLTKAGKVVHYDPLTEQGFFWVDPRPGIDLDLIREPDGGPI